MRKVAIGFVAFLLISTASVVGASGVKSMIGKKVTAEATIFVNGESVSDAIILDGTTYVPARELVEAMDSKIKYTAPTEKGGKAVIDITKPNGVPLISDDVRAELINEQLQTLIGTRDSHVKEIARLNELRNEQLKGSTDEVAIAAVNKKYDGIIAERQIRVDELNAQIAELEAERDELLK